MASNDEEAYGQIDVFELYHLLQEDPRTPSRRDGGPVLPALGHAVAGAVASALAKTVVYPIEIVVTRMQVQRQLKGQTEAPSAAADADAEYTSLTDAARKIYRNEGGIRPFYTGLSSDVVKGVTDSFLFFLSYQFMQTYLKTKQNAKRLPIMQELSVGVVAGCFSKSITTPIQNIVTRQQTAALMAARDPTSSVTPDQSDKLSVKDIALQIRSEKGLAGFWSGYSAAIILTLNPAITFALENFFKRLIPKERRANPPPALTFLLAALSKVFATVLTYPVMLAKSRAQTSKDSPQQPNKKSNAKENLLKTFKLLEGQAKIVLSLRKIYMEEGLQGLFCGVEGEVLKGFIQHGLTMMLKDKVHGGVIVLYYMLLKLTKRWPENLEEAQEDVSAVAGGVAAKAETVGSAVADGVKKLEEKVTGGEE